MKKKVFISIIAIGLISCITKKNEVTKSCEYSIIFNNQIIELSDRKDIIWLSSYTSGLNYRKLRKKIDVPGMKIDFAITENNLRQRVFNKICVINEFYLDSVVFFNMKPHNKISYRLVYKKDSKD